MTVEISHRVTENTEEYLATCKLPLQELGFTVIDLPQSIKNEALCVLCELERSGRENASTIFKRARLDYTSQAAGSLK
jgi:hypothetical protein